MPALEQLGWEIDPKSALRALAEINQGLSGSEKNFEGTGAKLQGAFERVSKTLLQLNDKQIQSQKRLVESYEREADFANKSGVDKIIARRDALIRKLGDNEQAINKVRIASEKLIAAQGGDGGLKAFGENVKRFMEDPLNSAKAVAGSLFEMIGTGGAVLAAGATIVGAFAAAGFEAAKSLGEFGIQTRDVELRTGLAAKEVGQFSFAARAAGADVSIFERLMRGLTTAVDDFSSQGQKARDALKQIGVAPRDLEGNIKPTSELLLQVSEGLNRIPGTLERNKLGMDIFKRAWIEAAPAVLELSENVRRARELGFGVDEASVERMVQYNKTVTEAETQWNRLKRAVQEPLAAILTVSIKALFDGESIDTRELPDTMIGRLRRRLLTGTFSHPLGTAEGTGGPVRDTGSELADRSLKGLQDQTRADAEKAAGQAGVSILDAHLLSQGLQAQQLELAKLKEAYDKALVSEKQLAEGGTVLPALARKHVAEVNSAREAYQKQSDLVKQLEKNESRRIANLEKARDLIHEGETFYRFGNGTGADVFVTGSELEKSNRPPRKRPSLFGVAPAQDQPILTTDYDRKTLKPLETTVFDQGLSSEDAQVLNRRRAARDPAIGIAAINAETDAYLAKLKEGLQVVPGLTDAERERVAGLQTLERWLASNQSAENDYADSLARVRRELAGISEESAKPRAVFVSPSQEREKAAGGLTFNSETSEATTPEILKQRNAGDVDKQKRDASERLSGIHVETDATIRLLELRSGPGGELETARTVSALRKGAIDQEFAITGDINKYREESLRNELDLRLRIAEIEKQQLDSIKRETESLAHTLFTRTQDFSKQLSTTIRDAFLKPIEEGIGDVVSRALRPLIYGQDGQGGIAGILKAPFGQKVDPVKASTDLNTQATIENSLRLAALTAAFSGVAFAGGTHGALPAFSNAGGFNPFGNTSISTIGPSQNASSQKNDAFARFRLPDGLINRSGEAVEGVPSFGNVGLSDLPLHMAENGFGGFSSIAPNAENAGLEDLPLHVAENASYSMNAYNPGVLPDMGSVAGRGFGGFGLPGFGWPGSSAPGFGWPGSSAPGFGWPGSSEPGGTPPFLPSGTSGKSGIGGFGLPSLTNLKGMFGIGTADLGGAPGVDGAPGTDLGMGTTIGSVAGSPFAGMAGMMAAKWGLMGSGAGTWGGVAAGTAGGALIGMQYGGPLGAAIGAAAGFGIGIGEKLAGVESKQNEAKRLVKETFHISISNQTADQIVAIAKQKYGGKVSIAVRDPEVRKMLELYAAGTNQNIPLSATTPRAGALAEVGGSLYQESTSVYGRQYAYASSLPVLGGPAGTFPSSGPSTVVLSVNGQSAADLLEGRITNTVDSGYVADRYSGALAASDGRRGNSAMIQAPGLIVS